MHPAEALNSKSYPEATIILAALLSDTTEYFHGICKNMIEKKTTKFVLIRTIGCFLYFISRKT